MLTKSPGTALITVAALILSGCASVPGALIKHRGATSEAPRPTHELRARDPISHPTAVITVPRPAAPQLPSEPLLSVWNHMPEVCDGIVPFSLPEKVSADRVNALSRITPSETAMLSGTPNRGINPPLITEWLSVLYAADQLTRSYLLDSHRSVESTEADWKSVLTYTRDELSTGKQGELGESAQRLLDEAQESAQHGCAV